MTSQSVENTFTMKAETCGLKGRLSAGGQETKKRTQCEVFD